MIFSVMYDILSPLIVGRIESVISGKFQLSELWRYIILYGAMLIVSLISAYFQAIILQKTGQRIITRLRCDLFDHIEHLSHAQLNEIPVGKLVTRVSNDTEAIPSVYRHNNHACEKQHNHSGRNNCHDVVQLHADAYDIVFCSVYSVVHACFPQIFTASAP